MRKIIPSIIIVLLTLCFANFGSVAEDSLNEIDNSKETELNFFTGMFDFSDDKQSSGLLGLQHQNEELFRDSFLGKLSPITGGFFTEKNSLCTWLLQLWQRKRFRLSFGN